MDAFLLSFGVIFVASTAGMVAADAVAIGVGALLGRALPERVVRLACAALFVAFGVWLVALELRS